MTNEQFQMFMVHNTITLAVLVLILGAVRLYQIVSEKVRIRRRPRVVNRATPEIVLRKVAEVYGRRCQSDNSKTATVHWGNLPQ